MKKRIRLIAGGLLVFIGIPSVLEARENFKLIRVAGEVADGTSGKPFQLFSTSIINDDLDIGYIGSLKTGIGINLTNNDGFWTDDPDNNQNLVEREGGAAPGIPGGTFTNLITASTIQINDAGAIAVRAIVKGVGITNANRGGIWSQTGGPGSLTLVARDGDPAPGTDGVFSFTGLPAQDNSPAGNIYFKTRLTGGTVTVANDTAIYGYLGGVLTLLIREGDVTPPLAVGATGPGTTATFGQILGEVTCSDSGNLIFAANYGGVTNPFSSGLLTRDLGTSVIAPVMQEGDPLPDSTGAILPGAPVIDAWPTFGTNDSGEIIARVGLRFGSGGVSTSNNEAIVSDAGGLMRLLAREGDVTPEGGNTHFIFRNVFIGNSSATCIGTTLNGNVNSIYSAPSGGAFTNIAKEGSLAPGTSDDYQSMGRPAMNHRGQVLFVSTLTGSTTENAGLWRTDGPALAPADPLGLLSRKGDIEDNLCSPIIAYDLNTPNQPTGGVSGSGRAINDTDNLVVSMISATSSGSLEGVYILGDLGPTFCDPPANELRNIAAGTGPIAISWTPPTVVDDSGLPPVVVASHSPGDLFPPGVTVVTYTATDNGGNVSTLRFRVIVTEIRDVSKLIADPGLLVRNNDPAPPSHLFHSFSRVCLNDNEDVTFEAAAGTGIRGIWSNGGGAPAGPLTDVAVTNDPAFSGLLFDRFFDIRISDRGRSSFGGRLKPGLTALNDSALFMEDMASVLTLSGYDSGDARDSTGAPTGRVFRQLYPQAVAQSSAADAVFYPAHLLIGVGGVGPSGDTGIWHQDANSGALVEVVGEGNPITVPELAGLSYGTIAPRVVTGGDPQFYSFSSVLSGAGVTGASNEALYRGAFGSTPDLIAREADDAPNVNPSSTQWKKSEKLGDKLARRDGGRYNSYLSESLSPSGRHLAFRAHLKLDGAVSTANDRGIWRVDDANIIHLVARENHQAPGFADGVCFGRFDDVLIDDDGWVSFRAWLQHDSGLGINSSNDAGIWTNEGGVMRWVAHEGQLAPNTDGGVVLRIDSFSQLDRGMAAILTLSVGIGDVVFSNNICVVSGFDGLTGLMEINLREGDRFDAGRTVLDKFTIFAMDHPFNPAGGSGGLSTAVQGSIDRLVLRAGFTGSGSGVLVRALSDTGS